MASITTCSWRKSSAVASSSSPSPTPAWRQKAAPLSGPTLAHHSRQSSFNRSRSSSTSSPCSSSSRSSSRSSSFFSTKSCLPSYSDLTLGSVLYLPESPPDQSSVIYNELSLGSRLFGHPVVIIGKSVEGGEQFVKMRMCTTFRGQHINEAKHSRFHEQFILVENTQDCAVPADGIMATTEPGSARFRKRTYIDIKQNYTIEYKHLAPWAADGPVAIDEASTQRLVRGYRVRRWSPWT
ncbi:hypothetical protein T440DRAFT_142238 [Plenodomus tracheiphilus IPT5]|uniref:Uncharacterized protein n=1 Tax=Plenodomus tracheiphilus IPT5 TaxID=1408161 RepID=A0A6A7B1E1_9PLEO|nr:hypothetical protein T440DRAFT_142238 [Plenodomus tracheiphilus IPT5]